MYLQVPGLGLHFGPHFPERKSKFKEVKSKKKKMKSKAKAERERVDKRPERQKRKAEKVERRAQKKEEERLKRAERGEPEVARAKKSATNSHHGTEQVDSTILKLLRKSHRSKKAVPQKKEEKVGRPEVASQWRGVREERHEANQEKKQRKKLKPNTPSPRHFLPDDSSSLQIPISAETSTLQQSFPEDPSSQDHHPRTPSPHHFLPDDLCSQDQHPRTPSPRHYYPEDFLPLRNVISAEQPTLQQPSKPLPPHLPRKKSANPKTVTYVKMESPEEYKQNIRKRIDKVLKIASAGGTPITYKMYEKAVIEQPRKGSEVLLQRDIDEIYVNNYNAEWIINWDANIDISPVYDYYGTITYITDYFTKVSSIIWKCLLVQP